MTVLRAPTGPLPLAALTLLTVCSAPSIVEAGCLPPMSCVCDNVAAGTVLRGVVRSIDGSRVELETKDVFRDGTLEGVVAGDVIGGSFDGRLPCSGASLAVAVQPGLEVLAFWQRGTLDLYPDCTDYRSCTLDQCGPGPEADPSPSPDWDRCDTACIESTRNACAARGQEARLNGRLVLFTWGSGARRVRDATRHVRARPPVPVLIYDEPTGQILFVGRLLDPS